ncbi:hypothetical protein M758_1G263400 [Ceratodon purpureus]|nr:hypothetical protein M758_1G263400 [Ceratodon purpureus]
MEVVGNGDGLMSSFSRLTISSPWIGKEQNVAIVNKTLEDHASFLIGKSEFRELVVFVKATHFDFSVCRTLIYHTMFLVLIWCPFVS